MIRPLALVLVLLVGCGGRPASSTDVVTGDRLVPFDRGRSDTLARDRGPDGPSFCSGGPKVVLAGATLVASKVQAGATITQCCQGEFVRLHAAAAAGNAVEVEATLLRFPDAQLPTHLNLANLPKGISVGVYCAPFGTCGGGHNPVESYLEGHADIAWTGAFPGYTLTLCLAASPKSVDPSRKPVQLWVPSVTVHTACIYGMDQSCNDSPNVSAIYGHCNEDSTCACNPGHAINPVSGRCL